MQPGQDYNEKFRWILDSLATGVFTVDKDFIITYFNSQAEILTGYSKKEALGRYCWEIFKTNHCKDNCNLKLAMEEDSKIFNIRLSMHNRFNKEIPVAVTVAVLHDNGGNVLGGVESFQDDRARATLEKEVKGTYEIQDFVTKNEYISKQLHKLPKIADSSKPILILGETGVGKDFLARIVHNVSNRRQGPYIKVNCAAIPSTMLESELFGHRKGAFTDATHDKPGKFKLAHNGTILLDELGELQLDMQAKLLQVIEDKEYFPLGATKIEWVNSRIIATTNCSLEDMVNKKVFRKDLYYRLKMCELHIPPVREREEDLETLINIFLERAATINNKEPPDIASDVMHFLKRYNYPGNVREMKNILEFAVMICNTTIHKKDLPEYLLEYGEKNNTEYDKGNSPIKENIIASEIDMLLQALNDNRWNMQNTAQSLGINRTTLWRKMKKYNISKR